MTEWNGPSTSHDSQVVREKVILADEISTKRSTYDTKKSRISLFSMQGFDLICASYRSYAIYFIIGYGILLKLLANNSSNLNLLVLFNAIQMIMLIGAAGRHTHVYDISRRASTRSATAVLA